jgi:hypothetical protein
MRMEHWWNESERKPELLGEKLDHEIFRKSQVPKGMTWDQTRESAVRGPRLTT